MDTIQDETIEERASRVVQMQGYGGDLGVADLVAEFAAVREIERERCARIAATWVATEDDIEELINTFGLDAPTAYLDSQESFTTTRIATTIREASDE